MLSLRQQTFMARTIESFAGVHKKGFDSHFLHIRPINILSYKFYLRLFCIPASLEAELVWLSRLLDGEGAYNQS